MQIINDGNKIISLTQNIATTPVVTTWGDTLISVANSAIVNMIYPITRLNDTVDKKKYAIVYNKMEKEILSYAF